MQVRAFERYIPLSTNSSVTKIQIVNNIAFTMFTILKVVYDSDVR